MIRPHFASAIAIAAMLAAAPAFAATSSGSASTADSTSKPLCSSFKNPNAGKLADKDTGRAKEHSASPVHQDCIPDSASGPSATSTPSPSASANYGGLRDTTSNAQSTMPSTTDTDVNANVNADVNAGVSTTTPKMSGDSSSR